MFSTFDIKIKKLYLSKMLLFYALASSKGWLAVHRETEMTYIFSF